MELLIIIVIGVIIYGLYVYYRDVESEKANENMKSYSLDSSEVDKNYAEEAIKFFNGYLSLCANHTVIAVCSLSRTTDDDFGINTEFNCTITAIDDEHGDEAFLNIQNNWLNLRQKQFDLENYSAVVHAGDDFIKNFFGCKDLHYAFTEADEYKFTNSQTVIKHEFPVNTHHGAKWNPTLVVIKQELLKLWPNANIKIAQAGMIVDYK